MTLPLESSLTIDGRRDLRGTGILRDWVLTGTRQSYKYPEGPFINGERLFLFSSETTLQSSSLSRVFSLQFSFLPLLPLII